jgi:AsmA protein
MARYASRLILWISGSLLALLLLALLAIVVVVLTIDPDRFRGRIETAASAALGRDVKLSGGLRWRLGWRTAIESRGGQIANAPGFGALPFAEWQSLRLGLALRPLLRREVELDRVELVGARLRLQRDASGLANWNFPAQPAGDDSAAAGRDLKIRVGSLSLRDAALSFQDVAASRDWQLQALQLDVQLPRDLMAPRLSFAGASLQARASGAPFAAAGVPFSLRADAVTVERSAGALDIPAWNVRWADASVDGSLQARATPAPQAQGRVSLQAPSLRALLATVSFPAPVTRDPGTLGPLRLAAQFHWRDGTARIDELDVTLDDTRVGGAVALPSLSPPALRFELAADQVAVDRYLAPEDAPGKPFELPLAALKALDAKGTLTIREARMLGAVAKELRIDVE